MFLDVVHTEKEHGSFKKRFLYPPRDLYDRLAQLCKSVVVGSCRIGGATELDFESIKNEAATAQGVVDEGKMFGDADRRGSTCGISGSGSGRRRNMQDGRRGSYLDHSRDCRSDVDQGRDMIGDGASNEGDNDCEDSSGGGGGGGGERSNSHRGGRYNEKAARRAAYHFDKEAIYGHIHRRVRGAADSNPSRRHSLISGKRALVGIGTRYPRGISIDVRAFKKNKDAPSRRRGQAIALQQNRDDFTRRGKGKRDKSVIEDPATLLETRGEKSQLQGTAPCIPSYERASYEDNHSVFGRILRDALAGKCLQKGHHRRISILDIYEFMRREFQRFQRAGESPAPGFQNADDSLTHRRTDQNSSNASTKGPVRVDFKSCGGDEERQEPNVAKPGTWSAAKRAREPNTGAQRAAAAEEHHVRMQVRE